MSVAAKVVRALPGLFGVHAMQYVIPLLTIPFLLRVLGLEGWGKLAMLMSFSQLALVPLEYGFHISGTLAAARCREDPSALARLFGAITAAKLLIGLVLTGPIFALALLVPHIGDDKALLAWALVATLIQAHDPIWLFLGLEQPNRMAITIMLARLAAVGGMVLFIEGPGDAWIYFLTQALAWFCPFALSVIWVARHIGFSIRHIGRPRQVLVDGARIFQLYLLGNVFDYTLPTVLGAVTNPTVVGLFVGADKLARATISLIAPFRNALLPRMTGLMHTAPAEAARLWRWAITRIGSLVAGVSLLLFLTADIAIRHFMGPEAGAAADILRVLCLFPPLAVMNGVLGVQWMVPLGQEATLRDAYIVSGCLRLLLCAGLGWEWGAYGAAFANILGESAVLLICAVKLQRAHMAPWNEDTNSRLIP